MLNPSSNSCVHSFNPSGFKFGQAKLTGYIHRAGPSAKQCKASQKFAEPICQQRGILSVCSTSSCLSASLFIAVLKKNRGDVYSIGPAN